MSCHSFITLYVGRELILLSTYDAYEKPWIFTCGGAFTELKALVIHNSLNTCGGGERVCIAIIEALKEMDFNTTLGTVEPTDWVRVKRLLGKVKRSNDEITAKDTYKDVRNLHEVTDVLARSQT